MIGIEHIEDWRGQVVVDRDGETLGKLDEVYYAPGTDRPVLIAIKSGLLGRKASLVPLHGATAGRDHLQVAHDKATIESTSEIHRGDTPSAEELNALGEAYGIRLASANHWRAPATSKRDAPRPMRPHSGPTRPPPRSRRGAPTARTRPSAPAAPPPRRRTPTVRHRRLVRRRRTHGAKPSAASCSPFRASVPLR